MITTAMVKDAMQRWECAGLVPPAGLKQAPGRVVESFLERFAYMDEATLKYVTAKVVLGEEWPKYTVVEQLAQEYLKRNSKDVRIDYFKDMRLKAFGEKEGFQEFVRRIAEKYFPGRAQEWIDRNSFTLYYYGVNCATCAKCEGKCGHNGHRMYLRIKRGTSNPVPWRSLEVCERFKTSIDSNGRLRGRSKSLEEQAEDKLAVLAALPDLLEENLGTAEVEQTKESYTQLDMFSEEAI